MLIERFDAGDVDRVLALDVFERPPDRDWTAAFLGSGDNVLLVARASDGQALGMLTATRLWHPDHPPELYVQEIGVAHAHRRRGVGTALVQAVLEVADDLACACTWLVTESGNAAAAGLYRHLDGVPDGDAVLWTWGGAERRPSDQ